MRGLIISKSLNLPFVEIPEDGHALVHALALVDQALELQAAPFLHDHLLVRPLDFRRGL